MLVQLPIVEKNCGIEIEDMTPDVTEHLVSYDDMLYFCNMWRRKGVARFFLFADPDQLYIDLFNSSQAFYYFLNSKAEEDKLTSKSFPILDAIACGDINGARNLAAISRSTWNKNKEYEEDFLYFYFLSQIVSGNEELLDVILKKIECIATDETRLLICKSLKKRDSIKFNEVIEGFLMDSWSNYEEAMEDETIDPEHAVSTAKLSIEGLAILRIALLRDINISSEYVLVPGILLKSRISKLPDEDTWRKMESYYELR